MPYKKKSDFPPSLKGFDPPLSVEQANGIARCADAVKGVESPWGVCISGFRKSHRKEGTQWVKKSAEGKESSMDKLDYGYGLVEAEMDYGKYVNKAVTALEEGDNDTALKILKQCQGQMKAK